MTNQQQEVYKKTVKDALLSCSEFRRGSSKGTGALLLVSICKSARMNYDDFQEICLKCSAADSTLRDDMERWAVWQRAGSDNQHITAKVRDEFIKKHNGKPLSTRLALPVLVIKNTNKF